jgi:hypothetical protein
MVKELILRSMIRNVIKNVMATSLSIVEEQMVPHQLQVVSMKFLQEDIVNPKVPVLMLIQICL